MNLIKTYGLRIDVAGEIAHQADLFMGGSITPGMLEVAVKKLTNEETGNKIIMDLNAQLFVPMRHELQSTQKAQVVTEDIAGEIEETEEEYRRKMDALLAESDEVIQDADAVIEAKVLETEEVPLVVQSVAPATPVSAPMVHEVAPADRASILSAIENPTKTVATPATTPVTSGLVADKLADTHSIPATHTDYSIKTSVPVTPKPPREMPHDPYLEQI